VGFNIVRPSTKSELFSIMENRNYTILAGGTDLFVKLKKDLIDVDCLVDIRDVIDGPAIQDDTHQVTINATATHQELATSSLIQTEFPVLVQAADSVGGTQIRNMGTVGGNICNGSPSADTLLALYLLDAQLSIVGVNGEQTLPIADFIIGPGEAQLTCGEYLENIALPKLTGEYKQYFRKVGRRKALDISVCSMGYLLKTEDGIVKDFRLAYGAVAPTVLRIPKAEERLVGKKLTREAVEDCKKYVSETISPISDIRGSAKYRKTVSLRLLEELLEE